MDPQARVSSPGQVSPTQSDDSGDRGRQRRPGALFSVVFVLALTQGVVPVLSEPFLGGAPIWALPTHLPSPWSWLTAVGVIIAAVVVLAALDRADRRRAPDA